MGTKNPKGSVSVENIGGRIRLRWRYQDKRYSLNLFHFNRYNLTRAKEVAAILERDIISASFDFTLDRYKPAQSQVIPASKSDLVQDFEYWVREIRNMDCDRDIDYFSTRSMMRKWGNFDCSTLLRHLNAEKLSAGTYNRRLMLLRKFLDWTTRKGLTPENPLDDVLRKKTKRTEKLNRKPFSEDEISRILDALANNRFCSPKTRFKHDQYYPFVYFLFKTGVRNAEAVGLRVKHICLSDNLVHVNEALARSLKGANPSARIRKPTKNNKKRVLPLTADLKQLLLPLIQGKDQEDLVFTSHFGLAIDDEKFQKRIFRKILKGLNIEHRVLYACRHTFSSRCIHSGINPVTTAFLMGNSPETALRNYTHLVNLPKDLPPITSGR